MSSTVSPTPAVIEETSKLSLSVGCSLAIGGNILISISLNVQKYAHKRIEDDLNARHYTRYPIWWLGLVLMALGELGNFTAYGFAPASLVAPLGTTAVIANMFIAVMFLKEKLRPDDIFGVTFAVVGAFLLVSFSQKDEAVMNADELATQLTEIGFIVYVVIEVLLLLILLLMKYRWHIENILVLLLIANLLASFTVICTKGLSGMVQLTFGGTMQLNEPLFWGMLAVMALMCLLQLKYLNQAMQLFDATIVVPTNFVFFTISAIVAAIIFYKEFFGLSPLEIFMFLFGCVMCFIGVYFITAGRAQSEDFEAAATVNALKKDGLLKYLPSWLIASETEARTLSRANSRRGRDPRGAPSSMSLSTADYVPILRKSGSQSSQGSLADGDMSGSEPPVFTPSPIPEERSNGAVGNGSVSPGPGGSAPGAGADNFPLKSYGTTDDNHVSETHIQ